MKDIIFKLAQTPEEFEAGANLFQQYARSLAIDLCFQGFADELKTIDKQYNQPTGALLIAWHETEAIGCAGIRELDKETGELKRMFVRTEYQGRKIGQQLLDQILGIAKELHYRKVRLDTLPTMTGAIQLYRSYGFYETPAYRFNPVEGAIYMEKE